MNLSLKNIKYCAWASEETPCFQATLHLDNRPFAHIRNDGKGGADHYDPIHLRGKEWWDKLADIQAYFAAMPPLQTQYGPLPFNLELWTGEQLAAHLDRKKKPRHAHQV